MEYFTAALVNNCVRGWQPKSSWDKLFDVRQSVFTNYCLEPMYVQIQPMSQDPPNAPAIP